MDAVTSRNRKLFALLVRLAGDRDEAERTLREVTQEFGKDATLGKVIERIQKNRGQRMKAAV